MCGSFLGGILFEINYHLPFFTSAALILLTIMIILSIPYKKVGSAGAFKPQDEKDNYLTYKFIYIALIANFASWAIIGTIRNIFPKLAIFLKFSPFEIGLLMFILGAAQTVMFFILGRTKSWHYRIIGFIFFQAVAVLYLIGMLFVNKFSAFAVIFLFLGLSTGMTYFSSIYYSLYIEADRGKRSGIHEAFLGSGVLFGPFFSGILAEFFGLRAPYLALAMLIISLIFMELWLLRKR